MSVRRFYCVKIKQFWRSGICPTRHPALGRLIVCTGFAITSFYRNRSLAVVFRSLSFRRQSGRFRWLLTQYNCKRTISNKTGCNLQKMSDDKRTIRKTKNNSKCPTLAQNPAEPLDELYSAIFIVVRTWFKLSTRTITSSRFSATVNVTDDTVYNL